MSNVSLVSICKTVESALVDIGEGVSAVCEGAADAVRWLIEETAEDKVAVDSLKEERRQDRLNGAGRDAVPTRVIDPITHSPERLVSASSDRTLHSKVEPRRITSADLHLRDTGSLVRSAEKLGYRMSEPATSQQSNIFLSRSNGERLALVRDASGSLAIQTAGQYGRIQELVRQHTLDRATDHLRGKGMTVRTATLANAEVQILAQEQGDGRRGGAELRTQTRPDGTVLVDVDKVKGNRCEGMVRELADAVGGEVSRMEKKDSYFQLPGEPANAKVRI